MTLSEEQVALRDAVRGLLRKHGDKSDKDDNGDRELWSLLCGQIGVAALGVPEEYGGYGGGLPELAVVAGELGATLAPVPFLGSTVLATRALLAADDPEASGELLPGLAGGEQTAALAWTGADGAWDPHQPALRAEDGELHGTAHYVLDGDTADVLLAVARVDDHIGLFRLDPQAGEVTRRHTPGMDRTRRLAVIEAKGARARRIGSGDFGGALRQVRNEACVVLAAEQAEAAAWVLETTVEYTRQRKQFGRPIGGFQALKHRMADLYVLVETARSVVASAVDDADERSAAVAATHCAEAFHSAAAEMIQMHGGIAITWEHAAHRYLKRAHAGAQLLGQPHRHLTRVTAHWPHW